MLNLQQSKLSTARHTSHLGTSRPSVLCSTRAATVTASARKQVFCFDIDTILSGLEPLYCRVGQECWQHVPAACAAAGQECLVPGSHTLYTKIMAQLLPVVQHPAYEAALLMRLLAEEGVVGSRSASGRAGPVVGRPVRHSGSRPLLVQEIREHWGSEIQPTCLLRWSRQAGLTPEELQQQLQQAYQQVLSALDWQVLDQAGVCHGSSRATSSPKAPAPSSSSSSTSSSSSGGGTSRQAPSSSGTAAATAVAPAAATAAAAASMPDSEGCLVVQPYTSVVQAILSSQHQAVVASPYPLPVTQAALAAAGLRSSKAAPGAVSIVQGLSLAQCAQQLLEQQQQQQQQRQDEEPPALAFILSSPSKARLVQQQLAQQQGPSQQAAGSQALQQQQQVLQVGEWACGAPSLRAKALACPQLGLLSEVGLADMLGVGNSDAVMDCIAWRG